MARLYIAALTLLISGLASGQPLPGEMERLTATGKLWITVKYFHPYLAYRAIDWDKALVDTLPAIRSAKSQVEYAGAIQKLLDALGDSSTYVLSEPADSSASDAKVPNLDTESVVIDLRGNGALSNLLDTPVLANRLTGTPLDAPAQQSWVHTGFQSAFYTKPGAHFPGSDTPVRKVSFVLGENSRLPAIAAALAASGRASVFSESPHYQIAGTDAATIPMGGFSVVVRLSEPIVGPVVQSVSHEKALAEAEAGLRSNKGSSSSAGPPRFPSPQPDSAYPDTPYPSTEYRILASCKIWGAFHYFFAYRDLMDEDWDDLFPLFLPKLIAAKDSCEYNLAIAEWLTHTADSQSVIESAALSHYFGEAPAGLRVRLIEKHAVITEVLDPDAAKAGVQLGDIVKKVDGEAVVERFKRQAQYVSASTTQRLSYDLLQRILNGPNGSSAELTIEDRKGDTKQVSLKRDSRYEPALQVQRTGDVIKLLPGNIGYADLDRLSPAQVNDVFDKFHDAKAIIFDLRGRCQSGAEIAGRLTDEKNVPAALITGPITLQPDVISEGLATQSASYFSVQTLPNSVQPKYKGKTVALIDERTIGPAEHAGLFLEVANKTEFVGSPSAGADSEPSIFVVPGGITIRLSSRDVRHANGGKLQRLGIQPGVLANSTVVGIRAGRDEVLAAAIQQIAPQEEVKKAATNVMRAANRKPKL